MGCIFVWGYFFAVSGCTVGLVGISLKIRSYSSSHKFTIMTIRRKRRVTRGKGARSDLPLGFLIGFQRTSWWYFVCFILPKRALFGNISEKLPHQGLLLVRYPQEVPQNPIRKRRGKSLRGLLPRVTLALVNVRDMAICVSGFPSTFNKVSVVLVPIAMRKHTHEITEKE